MPEAPGEQPPPLSVSIFSLVEALKDILKRTPKESVLEISAERFTVAEKINHVLDILGTSGGTATFEALFERGAPRGEIIVTFLAILELVKLLLIKIHQTEDGIIRVYSASPVDEGAPKSEKSGTAGLGVNGGEEMEGAPEAEAAEAGKED
jgi:segregation and condensation protein A